jgi:NADH-quinone oxidoreductase subunit E
MSLTCHCAAVCTAEIGEKVEDMSEGVAASRKNRESSKTPVVPQVSQEQVEKCLASLGGQISSRNVNLIGVLQEVQDDFGYLPPAVLSELSKRTRIPLSRIYGVVSFYAQFYTEPRGKHTIRCCCGTACHVKGATQVVDAIRETLGIEAGESTPDMKFNFEMVACLGTCFLAPVMMIDNQYFGNLTPQRVASILANWGDA